MSLPGLVFDDVNRVWYIQLIRSSASSSRFSRVREVTGFEDAQEA